MRKPGHSCAGRGADVAKKRVFPGFSRIRHGRFTWNYALAWFDRPENKGKSRIPYP
jgi:hypothetical protein